MAEEKSFKLNIPAEAIRTMKKDLAGITHGQWNLILEENEMNALLEKYKQRVAEQSHTQGKIKKEKSEEEEIVEKIRQAAKEKEKQEKSEQEDNAQNLEDKAKDKRKEDKRKEEREVTEEEKANEQELKMAAEIRRRALEREKLVREKLDTEKDKDMLAMEERHLQEEKERREKDLQIRIEELNQALKELATQKIPLDESKKYYLDQKTKIEKDLEPILESERKIEDNIKFIGNIEKTAITPRQRRKAEQERHLAEKEREAIESQRWDYEQKKRKIEKQIQEIDFGYQQLAQQEEKTKQEIKDAEEELGKINKEKEKIEIEHRISQLMKEKMEYSRLKKTIVGDRKEIEEKLAEIITQEEKIEKEVNYLQEEEKLSEGDEKERVEKERAKLEAIRSTLEKRRWKIEEEKQKIRLEENRINLKHDKILEVENQLRKRIQEINSLLGIEAPLELKREEPKKEYTEETETEEGEENVEQGEEEEQEEKKGSVGLQAKKIGEIRPKTIGAPEEKEKAPEEDEGSEAKKALAELEQKKRRQALLERLRAKRIQGVEQKEKNILERIRQGVSPGAGATHEEDNANIQPSGTEPKTPLKPESAVRTPMMTIGPEDMGKKPWMRLAIIIGAVILIIAVIGFWYWYANIRENGEEPTPSPSPSATPPAATTTPTTTPAIERPAALIPVESAIPKEITHIDEIQAFISEIFNNQALTENQFTRLLIKDSTEYLGLNKILPQLYLSPPPTLYSQVKDDATFYIYRRNQGQEKYNVFGFVAKMSTSSDALAGEDITNEWSELLAELMAGGEISEEDLFMLENYTLASENLQNTMSEWEKYLLTQVKYLADSFGKENIAENAIFKQELYGGYNLRYISLVEYPDCFGVCYTITEDKLHIATCCKPIVELIKTNNQ
ncbi:hypothetical protein KJ591_02455 [Patescibacteria group bacterium]|nr:hypothetical protein [Patescibacteria group bacterium]